MCTLAHYKIEKESTLDLFLVRAIRLDAPCNPPPKKKFRIISASPKEVLESSPPPSICDNWKKYNTSDCELSDEAEKMCTIFMKQCDEKLQESGNILNNGVRLEESIAENEKPNSENEVTRNTTSDDIDSPNGRTENRYDSEFLDVCTEIMNKMVSILFLRLQ